MKFNCPSCQQKIEAPPEYAGLVINCPACQRQFQVPAAPPLPPPLPQLSISRPPAVAPPAAPRPFAAQTAAATAQEFPEVAPLAKRVVAKVLDYVFQIVILAGIGIGWSFLQAALFKGGTSRETIIMLGIVVGALILLTPFFYNYLPLANSGATWGKKMLGLAVVRQNGQRLGYAWAFLRLLAEYVCVGACYGIALAIFVAVVRAQMHGPGHFTPPPMPRPGQPFATPQMHSDNGTLKTLMTLPVFLLMFVPYIPAFFTKGRRATHDLIARTLVISR